MLYFLNSLLFSDLGVCVCVPIYTYLPFNLVIPKEKVYMTLVENSKPWEVRYLPSQFGCPWDGIVNIRTSCKSAVYLPLWNQNSEHASPLHQMEQMWTYRRSTLPAYRAGPHFRSEWLDIREIVKTHMSSVTLSTGLFQWKAWIEGNPLKVPEKWRAFPRIKP